jgi:hypothetical protein
LALRRRLYLAITRRRNEKGRFNIEPAFCH